MIRNMSTLTSSGPNSQHCVKHRWWLLVADLFSMFILLPVALSDCCVFSKALLFSIVTLALALTLASAGVSSPFTQKRGIKIGRGLSFFPWQTMTNTASTIHNPSQDACQIPVDTTISFETSQQQFYKQPQIPFKHSRESNLYTGAALWLQVSSNSLYLLPNKPCISDMFLPVADCSFCLYHMVCHVSALHIRPP